MSSKVKIEIKGEVVKTWEEATWVSMGSGHVRYALDNHNRVVHSIFRSRLRKEELGLHWLRLIVTQTVWSANELL